MSTNDDARPPLSRRGFFTAGTALAAATAVPVVALAAPEPTENPDLLAMVAKLDEAEAAHTAALEAKRAARAMYERIKPAIPRDLILSEIGECEEYAELRFAGSDEKCIRGGTVFPEGNRDKRPRQIITAARLRRVLSGLDGRRRIARLVKARLSIVEAYEAAIAEAARISDVHGAADRHGQAYKALEKVIGAVFAIPAVTLSGVVFKARAMVSIAPGSVFNNGVGLVLIAHGNDLAAEIVSIAGKTKA